MPIPTSKVFDVNGRTYHPPARPVVVICLDGTADEYLDAAIARGGMPNLQRMSVRGFRGLARGALPSFTNVNNASIVTGVPPATHGISGNFFLDPATGEEVMMNSAKYLRAPTILAAAAKAGRVVAMGTAKKKLRDMLSHKLNGIAFSSEKANQAQEKTHGIGQVENWSASPPRRFTAPKRVSSCSRPALPCWSRSGRIFFTSRSLITSSTSSPPPSRRHWIS